MNALFRQEPPWWNNRVGVEPTLLRPSAPPAIALPEVRPTLPSRLFFEAPTPQRAPKILLYSHDTFGLGNIRRTLLLAEAVRAEYPDAAVLLVTGSPVIHAFRIPDGIDYIKLPCLDRTDFETYAPRFLGDWTHEVQATRQAMLNRAILGFDPDLMIVDKRPAGVDNELLEVLELLYNRPNRPRLVLGVRDILDDPERTRASLQKNQAFDLIGRYYDEVWVYGAASVYDHVTEYGYPKHIMDRTVYCGYLQRPTATVKRKEGPPRVLVTTGGGGDGAEMIEAYLEGLLELPRRVRLKSKIIFGPQMPTDKRDTILARFAHLPDVKFCDFKADLTKQYAKADVVVAMAGYNTVCELLSFGKPAVLVPRAHPAAEQLIRARRLAELGFFDLVEPDTLSPHTMMDKVLAAVNRAATPMPAIDLGGLTYIQARLRTLLTERRP